ncbi:MAG TPA: protein kinase, partial [Polyangiaceae bacterium]|nr:protein kinase [Polyangiaceae bacterium]
MRCDDFNTMVAFIEGTMAITGRASYREHLRGCEACRAVFAAVGATSPGQPANEAESTSGRAPIVVGDCIGRYRITAWMGAGAMGTVFRAHDPELARDVALKVLRSGESGEGAAQDRARLAREARNAARIIHPNVASVFDSGRDAGAFYIALELVEGQNLAEWLSSKPRSWRNVLVVFLQAARGLEAAHESGVVHRDFKPGNVLMGKDGSVKVVDFGLSRLRANEGDASAEPADHLSIAGTPKYMAPEQWAGKAPSPLTDQFSLCVALYEALNGEAPRRLQAIVHRGMSVDPRDRYPSMQALRVALELSLQSRRNTLWAAGLALVAAGLVAAAAVWSHGVAAVQAARRAPVLPDGGASAAVMRIIDLPMASSCAPAAIVEYRKGLAALRAASWQRAANFFEKAAESDPACPEPQLRMVMTAWPRLPLPLQREHLRHVLTIRDALHERDRLLLDAWSSMIATDAPRIDDAVRILEDAVRRFPNDAELRVLASIRKSQLRLTAPELEKTLGMVREAVKIDPEYADAWQLEAVVLGRLGRSDEEAAALDQCLAVAPGAVDCMAQRVGVLRRDGRCEDAVVEARHWVSWDPEQPEPYRALAAALAARPGTSRDAVREAMLLEWKFLSPELRELTRLGDSAALAIWAGDFENALQTAEAVDQAAAGDATSDAHLWAASFEVEALLESGRGARAARAVERFLRRNEAWVRGRTQSSDEYLKPQLLAADVQYGNRTPAR